MTADFMQDFDISINGLQIRSGNPVFVDAVCHAKQQGIIVFCVCLSDPDQLIVLYPYETRPGFFI